MPYQYLGESVTNHLNQNPFAESSKLGVFILPKTPRRCTWPQLWLCALAHHELEHKYVLVLGDT
jgi:hypothetical protein